LTRLRELFDMKPKRTRLFNTRLVQTNVFPALDPPFSVPRSFTVPYQPDFSHANAQLNQSRQFTAPLG
jgi:hypothetical protein